jgi:L-rhamnose mutarotase
MTWHPPLSPAEKEYLKRHQDEWPSVLAYKVSQLFGIPRTERGIRNAIKKLKEEQKVFS